MNPIPLIVCDRASITRRSEAIGFQHLNWTIHEGETWAITGPIGSGKTTLAEALSGQIHADGIAWPFIDRLRESGHSEAWPSRTIQRVTFKEESRLFSYSRHYYQQRFNFIEPDDDLTLDAFLHSGGPADDAERHKICQRLRIENLRDLSLIKLSNGQTRRARIARALIARPELLILDDPFMGLDFEGRAEVAAILGELIKHGQRLLLISRPDAIPDWVTHVLALDHFTVRSNGTRKAYQEVTQPIDQPSVARIGSHTSTGPRRHDPTDVTAAPFVEMRHVNVAYDNRIILHDLSWTVRAGERWALLGPNGSGKSTLLSLIAADHPQAYSNDIFLFGRKRGSGETIWEIKRHIGLVSPEIHLYFSEPLSAFRAAATGFFDVLAYRATSPEQDQALRELFDHFGLAAVSDRLFSRLSTGEQRLVLLIRALVKAPALLILDEPFQGLDAIMISRLRNWLDQRLRPEQALIFVSHLPEEIPSCVNKILRLKEGRAVTP